MAQASAAAARARGPWLGVAAAFAVLAAGLLGLWLLARSDPLHAAWQAASANRAYALTGTVAVAAGEQPAHYAIRGEGSPGGRLALTVSGGAVGAGRAITVAWPEVRGADGAALEPRTVAALLPLGDPLALLAAAHGARPLGEEPVGDRLCRRVDFLVGGRAYQAWWERHRQVLPFNADAGGMTTFVARGSAWLDPASGLPCRIRARSDLPRTPGEGRGWAEVDWTYGDWR
jgi:hypothetical protein